MDRKDIIATLIAIAMGSIAFCLLDSDGIDRISLIGTIVTILALGFTIYQQYRLKSTSKAILESRQKTIEEVNDHHYDWSLKRCLDLVSKIENELLKNEDKIGYIFIVHYIGEIQERLFDLRKIVSNSFHTELEKCLSSYNKESVKVTQVKEWIENCKRNSNISFVEKFKEQNKRLTRERFNLIEEINKPETDFDRRKFVEQISQFKNFLIEIKPLYSELVNRT